MNKHVNLAGFKLIHDVFTKLILVVWCICWMYSKIQDFASLVASDKNHCIMFIWKKKSLKMKHVETKSRVNKPIFVFCLMLSLFVYTGKKKKTEEPIDSSVLWETWILIFWFVMFFQWSNKKSTLWILLIRVVSHNLFIIHYKLKNV